MLPSRPARRFSSLPLLDQLRHGYHRADLIADLLAGVIVAIMLVPQGMAYAMLAGLPPQVGLYASILPAILYGLLGTSRALAVGPVALTSILSAATIGVLAEPDSSAYLVLATTLAFLVGLFLLAMGTLKLGSIVNFISHPVLSGFTSAAAIVIAASQLKYLLGIQIPRQESFFGNLTALSGNLHTLNWTTLTIGAGSILLMMFFQNGLSTVLKRLGIPAAWRIPLLRSGPLVVVALSSLMVWGLHLDSRFGVEVVAPIPGGLPPLSAPNLTPETLGSLIIPAITLGLVAFLESISVASALARQRKEKLDYNQELLALGAANLGAAFTGAYPVAGGFARSIVNHSVGARSGLASMITAVLIAMTLIFLMPLFTALPQAVLAAIIIVAVVRLIDISALKHAWRYSKTDAISLMATALAVLLLGIESGILFGIAISLVLHLWRTSRPHMAVVGQVGESEHYRNIDRHPASTCPHVLALRVDESLYFANAGFFERELLNCLEDRPDAHSVVLICSAVNAIDVSALEMLENLRQELANREIGFYLAEVKGPVMDRLERIGFVGRFGAENIFLSTYSAMTTLNCAADDHHQEDSSPDRQAKTLVSSSLREVHVENIYVETERF